MVPSAFGLPIAVALLASADHSGAAFESDKWMRWTLGPARLISLRKIYLLRRETFVSVDRGPGSRSMTAMQKLLVNLLVAAAAIARSQPVSADDKTVMLYLSAVRWRVGGIPGSSRPSGHACSSRIRGRQNTGSASGTRRTCRKRGQTLRRVARFLLWAVRDLLKTRKR